MKTEYEYINFTEKESQANRKTKIWSCKNNKTEDELGIVKWLSGWRQYCYFPTCQAVYSKGCLQDIVSFINQINQERRLTTKKLKENHGIVPEEANMI